MSKTKKVPVVELSSVISHQIERYLLAGKTGYTIRKEIKLKARKFRFNTTNLTDTQINVLLEKQCRLAVSYRFDKLSELHDNLTAQQIFDLMVSDGYIEESDGIYTFNMYQILNISTEEYSRKITEKLTEANKTIEAYELKLRALGMSDEEIEELKKAS